MSSDPPMTPQQASEAILARLECLPSETLSLSDCVGRVLRADVHAERDQPPFDRVVMDGIALNSQAWAHGVRRFKIQAMQAAGEPALTLEKQDQAIEIMTGASLSLGCDCVIPVEHLSVENGYAVLSAVADATPYANVHRRASDATRGLRLLAAGTQLRAPEIAVAASAGLSHLPVSRQPRIVMISTGNELVDPGGPIAEFQVRRSNVYAMGAALRDRGFLGVRNDHIADNESDLQLQLGRHLAMADVLLLSGGVSMGKLDLVPKVLAHLGVQKVLHRIAQRPGKPLWFGIGPTSQTVFGLPGNPVSTLVCLIRYVVPALSALSGNQTHRGEKIMLATPVSTRRELTAFLPVKIEWDDDGSAKAAPRPTNGSGDFVSLTGTDGFVELPPGADTLPRGFVASLYRW